ncbi:MAG: ferrous iron transporter B [Acidobacteria bacterium]|nr:ferrous iron transporter B [Acidobacteriota bacterium]
MSGSGTTRVRKVVLVGNANVGKSVVFGALTGRYAIVSNYPGTTVEFSRAGVTVDGRRYEIIDTPGINGLVPQSEDERVTRDILLRERPDIIVQVGDAKNIRRTLHLTLQLAEFGIPMVLNLNMIDECAARGIRIDTEAVSAAFGVPVNTSIATMGEGIPRLARLFTRAARPRLPVALSSPLADAVEAKLPGLPRALTLEWLVQEEPGDLPLEAGARERKLMEHIRNVIVHRRPEAGPDPRLHFEQSRRRFLDEFIPTVKQTNGNLATVLPDDHVPAVLGTGLALGLAVMASNAILPLLGIPGPLQRIDAAFAPLLDGNGILVGAGGLLVGEFGLLHPGLTLLALTVMPPLLPFLALLKRGGRFTNAFDRFTRRAGTGLAALLAVLAAVYVFVGVFGAQVLVGLLEDGIFNAYLNPPLHRWFHEAVPSPFITDLFTGPYGLISKGLTYSVGIVLPVVSTFFLAFGFLEDSGYLPRLSVLANRSFRLVGLNGKAVLPMVLGLGCGTMAVMTARVLNSRKERLIATLLLALGIPCSAQLGVMLGIFSGFSAWVALVVIGVVAFQTLLVGILAARLLPGDPSDFILEIPPVRYPCWKNIWIKTGLRVWWFLKEAVPLFLLGTFLLFLLDWFTVLGKIIDTAKPVVSGLLGLPGEAAQVFVMGFLRRDFGAAGLYDMVERGMFGPGQVAVTLVVLTLFVPCVASFFMIVKEQGLKKAALILFFVIPFAVLTGALTRLALPLFGV